MAFIFTVRNLSVVKHVSDYVMLIHVGKLVGRSNTYKIFSIPKQPNPVVSMMAISASTPPVRIDNMEFEGKYAAWSILGVILKKYPFKMMQESMRKLDN